MKKIAIATVAVLVMAGLAWVGYGVHQKRTLRAQVAQWVDAAGARMGAGLAIDIAAPTPQQAEQLDRLAGEADSDLQGLRAAAARPDPSLVETADAYLADIAAALKRQAGSARGRLKFTES